MSGTSITGTSNLRQIKISSKVFYNRRIRLGLSNPIDWGNFHRFNRTIRRTWKQKHNLGFMLRNGSELRVVTWAKIVYKAALRLFDYSIRHIDPTAKYDGLRSVCHSSFSTEIKNDILLFNFVFIDLCHLIWKQKLTTEIKMFMISVPSRPNQN